MSSMFRPLERTISLLPLDGGMFVFGIDSCSSSVRWCLICSSNRLQYLNLNLNQVNTFKRFYKKVCP